VKAPEEALEAARRAAASDPEPEGWQLDDPALPTRRLVRWAIIDPEKAQAHVYSTRRYGKPITALKRLLIRVMAQYLNEVSAQQSRFNAAVAAHVMRLEERVEALEQEHSRRPPAA
jgi:hypothetical protein